MFNCTAGRLCLLHLYSNAVRKHSTTLSFLSARELPTQETGRASATLARRASDCHIFFILFSTCDKPSHRGAVPAMQRLGPRLPVESCLALPSIQPV